MKMVKDYHNLYLKCHVLLLADAFEKFRNNSIRNYRLFPSHHLSATALRWDEMLNMTKVELELIPDPGIYIFFEKDMRGGVCYISNRYSKARNKYLKSYDPKQESKHIILIDANNWYDYAMSKFLPTSGFKRINTKEFWIIFFESTSFKIFRRLFHLTLITTLGFLDIK